MTTISTAIPAANPAANAPRAGGGVRGYLGDVVRAMGSGYAALTDATSVEAERASIHPFEGVTGLTGALRDATRNVRGLGRATGLLHTGAGFGMLIAANTVASGLRAPGDSVVDLTHRAADLIDGRDAAPAWSLGWGVRPAAPQAGVAEQASADALALAELGIG